MEPSSRVEPCGGSCAGVQIYSVGTDNVDVGLAPVPVIQDQSDVGLPDWSTVEHHPRPLDESSLGSDHPLLLVQLLEALLIFCRASVAPLLLLLRFDPLEILTFLKPSARPRLLLLRFPYQSLRPEKSMIPSSVLVLPIILRSTFGPHLLLFRFTCLSLRSEKPTFLCILSVFLLLLLF